MIAADYARMPPKPMLDGEPRYEDHPVNWKPEQGWFDDFDVRQAAYWALFAGAFGHTYGCHDIWQFLHARRKPVSSAPHALAARRSSSPGAWQMLHLRRLLLSRPFLSRVPDPRSSRRPGGRAEHVEATRDRDGASPSSTCRPAGPSRWTSLSCPARA